ncbi:LnmK family bifunctional acyltransferase/decarboxylase [Streptomyces sp. NPDC087440]|uniref:LnmK family bifunctional acyltransferase/decarboxylase n=1 Tax=Streptomyces sp. NPDC087440 TaxID=3365790 RepID=UPI0038239EC6
MNDPLTSEVLTVAAASSLMPDASAARRITVSPSMCGPGPLFFAQAGDWTWEAVGRAASLNTFQARTADGKPAYLAFSYFRTRGSTDVHPYGLTFGDELDLESCVYGAGIDSALTVHRLTPSRRSATLPAVQRLRPEELDHPEPGCLYVETFNRWLSRREGGSNQKLLTSIPVGFDHSVLPPLPENCSPRATVAAVRQEGLFPPVPGFRRTEPDFRTRYRVDAARDLNGAGLLYFASYFSIVDTAMLQLWTHLGRSEQAFLGRHLLDHQICYFANADPGTQLDLTVGLWGSGTDAREEVADVVLRDAGSGRLVAVASVRLRVPEV